MPDRPLGRLGHPVVLVAVVAFFLGVVVLHGLVIWEQPVARAAALAVVVGVTLLSGDTWRRGRFAPLAAVELRTSADGGLLARLVVGGQLVKATCRWDGRQLVLALPATGARELKVWAHLLTPGGESQPLGVVAELVQEDGVRQMKVAAATGWVMVPFDGRVGELRVALSGRQSG
ncbi:MAG: hypothetical protein HGA45_01045 [Chloroflexales bacterium]|nr:hypothetical protein [Chloroflexales bacterium]